MCDNLPQGWLLRILRKYQEKLMNRPFLLLAALAAAAVLAWPSGKAQAVSYCLAGETTECGIPSLEQCMAESAGNGSICVIDSGQTITVPQRPRQR
jgi:hypothetical protein